MNIFIYCHAELVREDEKIDKLKEILDELVKSSGNGEGKEAQAANAKSHAKAIIFVAKKISCDTLANQVSRKPEYSIEM